MVMCSYTLETILVGRQVNYQHMKSLMIVTLILSISSRWSHSPDTEIESSLLPTTGTSKRDEINLQKWDAVWAFVTWRLGHSAKSLMDNVTPPSWSETSN